MRTYFSNADCKKLNRNKIIKCFYLAQTQGVLLGFDLSALSFSSHLYKKVNMQNSKRILKHTHTQLLSVFKRDLVIPD